MNQIDAIFRAYRMRTGAVWVLSAASYSIPADGYYQGYNYQEAELCLHSTLYGILSHNDLDFFYKENSSRRHKNQFENRLLAIYDVRFFRHPFSYEMNGSVLANVISCAPPNINIPSSNGVTLPSPDTNHKTLVSRIHFILRVIQERANPGDWIILGPWGCGHQCQVPEEVADIMINEAADIKTKQLNIIFAVPGNGHDRMVRSFKRVVDIYNNSANRVYDIPKPEQKQDYIVARSLMRDGKIELYLSNGMMTTINPAAIVPSFDDDIILHLERIDDVQRQVRRQRRNEKGAIKPIEFF